MRSIRQGVVIGALLAVAAAAESVAQTPARPGIVEVGKGSGSVSPRRGFWIGLGLGTGGESFDLEGDGVDYAEYLYRPTVSLGLGGTVSAHLRLGGEVLVWFDDQDDAVESLSSIMLVARLYPIRTAGLYLKGGAGIGRSEIAFDYGPKIGDTGFAGLLGAGYELRVARNVFINPAVDWVQHQYTSRSSPDYRERLLNFSVGVTVQTGK